MRTTVLLTACVLFSAGALSFAPAPADAQSFNCRYARTADERVICDRPNLSRLDERLSRRYQRAYDRSGRGMRRLLEREQAAWLTSRHNCRENAGCIRRHYQVRIGELNSFGSRTRQFGYR